MIDKKILESLIKQGMTIKDIAERIDKSKTTVSRYMKKYNLKSSIGNQGARKHNFDESYFHKINTEEKAYWLGFIAADGCVYKNANAWRLQINLKASDIDHLSNFQKSLGSDYKIIKKNIEQSQVCQLKVNSKVLCFDLINLGIKERKSLEVKMPDMPNKLIKHFIRGYFDGDGNIKNFYDKNNRHRYNFNIVGGIDMLNSINNNMPCDLNLYKLKRISPIFSLETTKKDKLVKIYDFLYADATIYLKRKKDIYNNLMSRFVEMQRQ